MSDHHKTVPIQVWVDVDERIAEVVTYLNTIPGVRTHASCQGTIEEGGPAPYRAHVMATWPEEEFDRLSGEFDIEPLGDGWGYLYPRSLYRQDAKNAGPHHSTELLNRSCDNHG